MPQEGDPLAAYREARLAWMALLSYHRHIATLARQTRLLMAAYLDNPQVQQTGLRFLQEEVATAHSLAQLERQINLCWPPDEHEVGLMIERLSMNS